MKEIDCWRDVIALPVVVKKSKETKHWDTNELEEILTETVASCVNYCLEKDNGRIYTTLSGGIDSSFCLAKIRNLVGYGVPIYTFTIASSPSHPDIKHARIVAKKFRTIHHQLIPSLEEIKETGDYLSKVRKEVYLGDVAVFLLYKFISVFGVKSVIAHDGIDELLGGYWEHRKPKIQLNQRRVFIDFWKRLPREHLIPLEESASEAGISVVFPYLQRSVIEYISRIPVNERTGREMSKVLLREIAKKYLPADIIEREKIGFSGALH